MSPKAQQKLIELEAALDYWKDIQHWANDRLVKASEDVDTANKAVEKATKDLIEFHRSHNTKEMNDG